MRETLVDAGWGGLTTLVFSFVPFSSLLGGAVAGNRHDCGYVAGLGIGALAGVAAMVPLLALFVPALFIAGQLGFGIPPGTPGYGLFLTLAFALFLLYTVGLSALGGLVGVWVGRNTDLRLDPGRWI